jgi:type IV fimbrial biogenesis protein FimT
MQSSPSIPAASGFTLFELVMVILIVSILVVIGIPSFKYVTASNRIATEVNALLGDMRFARTEALKQGLPVTVCASSDGATCSTSNSWQSGWIMFSDPNNSLTPPAGPVLLRIQAPLSTAFNSTDTLVADNGFSAITFNREGFGATHIATATNTVTMELQSSPVNSSWTRCLVISPVGVLSIQKVGGSLGNC